MECTIDLTGRNWIALPLGGVVTYKPGTRILKYTGKLYAVDKNGTLQYNNAAG